MKRVTIYDVAAAAGVSKSTVSRLLNQKPSPLDKDKARRVRQIAAELGYMRDASAANLRLGRTGMIGVVVTYLADTVRATFFEEITRLCESNDCFAVAAIADNPEGARAAVERLLRQGAQGIILTTTQEGDTLPDELTARGIPFVLALRTDGRSPSAYSDDLLGGYLATRHLLDLGHRKIGLISGPVGASTAQRRVLGYQQALVEAGLAICPAYIAPATFGAEAGASAAASLLDLSEPPTAIFAVNDLTAIGAYSTFVRRGVQVPKDISLVGYSDIMIARHFAVPLTTIRVDYAAIARNAMALLLSDDHQGDCLKVAEPHLIVRESTAPRSS